MKKKIGSRGDAETRRRGGKRESGSRRDAEARSGGKRKGLSRGGAEARREEEKISCAAPLRRGGQNIEEGVVVHE